MDDFEREQLAVKAYRLSEMTGSDWKKVMPKYGHQLKEWRIIPNAIWLFLGIAGIFVVGFNWFFPWLPIVAFIVSLYSAAQIGSRAGNIDGFQTGYEWGKIDGVCRGLGIKEAEQEKLLQKARELIIEFKVHSGDPDLELGENFRNDV
jgi:hypothetical protein